VRPPDHLSEAHRVVLRQRTAFEPRVERLSLDELHDQTCGFRRDLFASSGI